ncbi:MAG TPA: type VI secretion system contractile sheath large subunit [Bryobacteraceae bacterium]|jgi:type VI secretion system protein ImpC
MPASAEIDIGLETRRKAAPSDTTGKPFRIALLGDFSGHAGRGTPRRPAAPVPIDSGNIEEAVERFDVAVHLTIAETPIEIPFRSLEDFHPDALQERLPMFQAFARLRAQLADPVTFPAAARFLGTQFADPAPGAFSNASLDWAPGGSAAAQPAPDPAAGWDDFIRRSVAAHLSPSPEPGPEECTAAVDAATGALMRACLAHAAFQKVESAWRSVSFLLERLETRADLRIELIDAAKEELWDLPPAGWSVAACLHRFAPEPRDCRLLAHLAAASRRAGGPVLAEIDTRLAGCASIADTPNPDDWRLSLDETADAAWRWLRADPDARWLGVALPRFLLRLPYGGATGEIASLAFEEMPLPPVHEAYLWGSPAVACVCLLGQAFLHHGWSMRSDQVRRLEQLPAHTYLFDGKSHRPSPAEVCLSERRAKRILADGAMPLVSARAGDSLRLLRFQSVADPPAPLAGPWEPPPG